MYDNDDFKNENENPSCPVVKCPMCKKTEGVMYVSPEKQIFVGINPHLFRCNCSLCEEDFSIKLPFIDNKMFNPMIDTTNNQGNEFERWMLKNYLKFIGKSIGFLMNLQNRYAKMKPDQKKEYMKNIEVERFL